MDSSLLYWGQIKKQIHEHKEKKVKAEKILVILGVLAVLSLVAGLVAGIMVDDSESTERQENYSSAPGMFAIYFCLWAAMNSKRQKEKAQQDRESLA